MVESETEAVKVENNQTGRILLAFISAVEKLQSVCFIAIFTAADINNLSEKLSVWP